MASENVSIKLWEYIGFTLEKAAELGGGAVFALDIYFAKYTDNRLLLQKKLTYIKD